MYKQGNIIGITSKHLVHHIQHSISFDLNVVDISMELRYSTYPNLFCTFLQECCGQLLIPSPNIRADIMHMSKGSVHVNLGDYRFFKQLNVPLVSEHLHKEQW